MCGTQEQNARVPNLHADFKQGISSVLYDAIKNSTLDLSAFAFHASLREILLPDRCFVFLHVFAARRTEQAPSRSILAICRNGKTSIADFTVFLLTRQRAGLLVHEIPGQIFIIAIRPVIIATASALPFLERFALLRFVQRCLLSSLAFLPFSSIFSHFFCII